MAGLEPATGSLTVISYYQLSYIPSIRFTSLLLAELKVHLIVLVTDFSDDLSIILKVIDSKVMVSTFKITDKKKDLNGIH